MRKIQKNGMLQFTNRSKHISFLLTRRMIIWISALFFFVPSISKSREKAKPKQTRTIKGPQSAKTIKKSKAPAIIGRASKPLPVIMLDPGHGGKDPGAIGRSGTYEKHIAYAAAQELSRQLCQTGRYNVVLTRNADRFVPLSGRVELAQKHRANLFISMHADALRNSSIRGASVYTLSNSASDAQTAALARVENNADRYGGPNVHAVSPAVQNILASLVKEETKKESITMAKSVVTAFRPQIGLLSNPRRHAAFVVLKSADIPSILVEMGFMSNRIDESALRQAAHRTVVASAMRNAIDRYFAIGGSMTHLTG